MINEGHQVANHSWSHLRPTELSLEEFLLEIDSAEEILQNYINRLEFFLLPPSYGLLTPEQIEEINYKGYKIISWSIDSLDWNVSEPEKIQDKVISSVHPGAIILMPVQEAKINGRAQLKPCLVSSKTLPNKAMSLLQSII